MARHKLLTSLKMAETTILTIYIAIKSMSGDARHERKTLIHPQGSLLHFDTDHVRVATPVRPNLASLGATGWLASSNVIVSSIRYKLKP